VHRALDRVPYHERTARRFDRACYRVSGGSARGGTARVARGNLIALYRGSAGATLSGSTVVAWADQTGDSTQNLARISGAITRNSANANFNGKATIEFAGGLLFSPTWARPPSQPLTVYCAFRSTSSGLQAIYDGIDNNRTELFLNNGGANIGALTATSGGGSATIQTAATVLNTAHIVAITYAGASSTIHVDAITTPSVTGNLGTGVLTGLCVGDFHGTSIPFIGSLGELSFWAGAHTLSQRREQMTAMSTSYGITVAP
jgi:hypothetical protein